LNGSIFGSTFSTLWPASTNIEAQMVKSFRHIGMASSSARRGNPNSSAQKKADKKAALEVLLGWQRAASLASEGKLTETRCRQIIGEILERTTGENIYDDSIEGFSSTHNTKAFAGGLR
jgi:hypothetical protein